MKKGIFALMLLLVVIIGCRTEFEQIRTSSDAALIYEKAMKYYEEGEYIKAQTLFELAIPAYRGKAEAEDIYYKYAYTYYYTRDYILASHYFKNFSNTYYNSSLREETDFMTAYANYRLSPSFKLDQTYSEKAIEGFQLFINGHPNSTRVSECNNLIDEIRGKLEIKAFEQGKLYFHLRQYSSAVQSFENMLKDYPETQRAEEARYFACAASFLLAEHSVFDKKEERYLEAKDKGDKFLNKYARSKYRSEIKDHLTNTNKELKKLKNDRYQG